MARNSRNVRRERNTNDAPENTVDTGRHAEDGQNANDEAQNVRRAGSGSRNVSDEPLPELSEEGGVEPLQENPADYNDRARDRELNEG